MSVELIDAERHKIVWGDQYKRPIEDLLDIQEEISKRSFPPPPCKSRLPSASGWRRSPPTTSWRTVT